MRKPFIMLILLFFIIAFNVDAQTSDPNIDKAAPTINTGSEILLKSHKKGSFFITPFYEFTSFKNMKLTSISSSKDTPDGIINDNFSADDINMHNDYFDTEYQNSMTGLKVGYQVFDGFGVSAYAGVNHFNFNSWVSTDNSELSNATSPAFTMGLAIDYHKVLTDRFIVVTKLSYNYCETSSIAADNTSGYDIISSSLLSTYWEANLALAYKLGKFYPFVGAGFTNQYVNSISVEKEPYTSSLDIESEVNTKYDSRFTGNSFYGFAGLEYQISHQITLYGRSSFLNPLRANFGLRIGL